MGDFSDYRAVENEMAATKRELQKEVDRVARRCKAANLSTQLTLALVVNAFLYGTRQHHVVDHQEQLIDALLEYASESEVTSETVWAGTGPMRRGQCYTLSCKDGNYIVA